MTYFDFDGQPIDMWTWCHLFENEDRFLAQTNVELPGGDHAFVSTVWLGLNYNVLGQVPLIFETMIFWESGNYGSEDYCVRTPSRAAALAEHDQAIEWARNLGQLPAGYRITEDRED